MMVLTIPRKRYIVIDDVTTHQKALDTFSLNVIIIIGFPFGFPLYNEKYTPVNDEMQGGPRRRRSICVEVKGKRQISA